MDPKEGGAHGACLAMRGSPCTSDVPPQCILFRAPARAGGSSGQEHAASVHLLVPTGMAEDTVSCTPHVCEARDQGSSVRSQRSSQR